MPEMGARHKITRSRREATVVAIKGRIHEEEKAEDRDPKPCLRGKSSFPQPDYPPDQSSIKIGQAKYPP
jgi:hypothetical protein